MSRCRHALGEMSASRISLSGEKSGVEVGCRQALWPVSMSACVLRRGRSLPIVGARTHPLRCSGTAPNPCSRATPHLVDRPRLGRAALNSCSPTTTTASTIEALRTALHDQLPDRHRAGSVASWDTRPPATPRSRLVIYRRLSSITVSAAIPARPRRLGGALPTGSSTPEQCPARDDARLGCFPRRTSVTATRVRAELAHTLPTTCGCGLARLQWRAAIQGDRFVGPHLRRGPTTFGPVLAARLAPRRWRLLPTGTNLRAVRSGSKPRSLGFDAAARSARLTRALRPTCAPIGRPPRRRVRSLRFAATTRWGRDPNRSIPLAASNAPAVPGTLGLGALSCRRVPAGGRPSPAGVPPPRAPSTSGPTAPTCAALPPFTAGPWRCTNASRITKTRMGCRTGGYASNPGPPTLASLWLARS